MKTSLLLLELASRSVVPVRFELKATHFASGEKAGPMLSVAPVVSCFRVFDPRSYVQTWVHVSFFSA